LSSKFVEDEPDYSGGRNLLFILARTPYVQMKQTLKHYYASRAREIATPWTVVET